MSEEDRNLKFEQYTMEDKEAARILLKPLTNYNAFAVAYGCSISEELLHWEDSLPLNDGSQLILRGMTSVLVSNELDDDGANKLLLGTVQCSVNEEYGGAYL